MSGRSGIVSSLLLTWVIEVGAFGDWVSGDMYNRVFGSSPVGLSCAGWSLVGWYQLS